MSRPLPRYLYQDPEKTLSRFEAGTVYQQRGCSACSWFDPERDRPCIKKMSPGKHWCRGFEES